MERAFFASKNLRMATWLHRKRERKEEIRDPTEKAFFSNEIVGNLANALVREANQNVLDEIKNVDLPVHVRIFLSGDKYAINNASSKKYLRGLTQHLLAEGNGILASDKPDFAESMPFIVYEDFNTKGLEGDPKESEYSDLRDLTKQHNFFYFWRAYGKSGKLAGKMGSWGVGKSVFPASSCINSFWAATLRESDEKSYLIGQAVLKTHNIVDNPAPYAYSPYGYFGEFEADGFPVPIENELIIQEFATAFRMKRNFVGSHKEQNTGVSIVVPFPRAEITYNALLYATIEQFFYPIILGKLVVDIQHEDGIIVLDKGSVVQSVKSIDFDSFPGHSAKKAPLESQLQLAMWMKDIPESEFHCLKVGNADGACYWRKDLFDSVDVAALQKDFEDGKPLAFRIPMKYQPQDEIATIRYFKAFIQKDDSLDEPLSVFIRRYLTITGIKSLRRKGVKGVVLVDDPDLITFFGHAEGPAHTGWHKDNFKAAYHSAEACISFVQRSLEQIHVIIRKQSGGLDKMLLKEFFFLEEQSEEHGTGESIKTDDPKKLSHPKPKIEKSIQKFSVIRLSGGFKVVSNPAYKKKGTNISLRVAYRQASNKRSFDKYSQHDFKLDDLIVKSKGLKVITQGDNTILLKATSKVYWISVLGFDKKRDLIVDVT
jgi:hypothetical protein